MPSSLDIFTGTNRKRSLSRRCIVAQHTPTKDCLYVKMNVAFNSRNITRWNTSKFEWFCCRNHINWHKFCTISIAMVSVRLHCTVACLQMWNNLASALPALTRHIANVWEITTKKLRKFWRGGVWNESLC